MPTVYEAQMCHAVYYETMARTADRHFLQGGVEFKHGLALFESEWDNIRLARTWAEMRSSEDIRAAKLCSDFLTAAPYCMDLRVMPQERMAWLNAALSAARLLGDRAAEGKHLGDLDLCYHEIGEYQSAAEFQKKRLAITHETGDRRGEGIALNNLGNTYHSIASLENPYVQLGRGRPYSNAYIWRAIECHQQALIIARDNCDRLEECLAWRFLARTYLTIGLYRRATKYLDRALSIAREIASYMEQFYVLLNLGHARQLMGNYRRSIQAYEQALDIQDEIGNHSSKLQVLGSLGSVYSWMGKSGRAIEIYRDKLTLARKIGDLEQEGNALSAIGSVYWEIGDLRQAIAYDEQALIIFQEAKNRLRQATVMAALGQSYLRLKDKPKASEFLLGARAGLEEMGLPMPIGLSFGISLLSWPEKLLPIAYSFLKMLSPLFPLNGILARLKSRILDQRLRIDDRLEELADISEKIERDPANAQYHRKRGYVCYELADYRNALAAFLHAIKLDPNNALYYSDAAMVCEAQQDYSRALDYYDHALLLKAKDARLWSNRGLAHYTLGNFTQAVDDFNIAIKHRPKRARYYSHRALALYCLGWYEEAECDFAKAVSLKVDNNVFCDLATRSAIEGDSVTAAGHLRRAFKLDRADTLRSIKEDRDFDRIRFSAEFVALMAEYES